MLYLDANSTSRLRPQGRLSVERLMLDEDSIRNPSSVHTAGRRARTEIQRARTLLLGLLGLSDRGTNKARVVFTSGATEACNQMIIGSLSAIGRLASFPGSVVISTIEHPAVLEPVGALAALGWRVNKIAPTIDGIVKVQEFLDAIEKDTALVSLMAANNETGAIQPVREMALALRASGYRGLIVSDTTQYVGKQPFVAADLFHAGVNMIVVSGHKMGALAGVGALIINEAVSDVCFPFEPILKGGPQETGYRGGTENLVGIVSMGAVAESLTAALPAEEVRIRELRERMWSGLRAELTEIERITPLDDVKLPESPCSLPNTLLVRFSGIRGDDAVVGLDLEGLCASVGSACASGKQGVSQVLLSMGMAASAAREVVRFSLDWDATEELVDEAVGIVAKVILRMRGAANYPVSGNFKAAVG